MAKRRTATKRTRRPLKVKAKEKDGKITTAGRRALGRGQFALPPGVEERRRGIGGRYPIYDLAHARNALARVAQHGTPTEKMVVRRKVKAKYPQIEVGGKKTKK